MKSKLLVLMCLGLAAFLVLPMPGLSASRNLPGKIDRKKRQVAKKKRHEGVLTQDITGYSVKIRALQGDIHGYASREQQLQGNLDTKRAQVQRVQDQLQVAQDRLARLRTQLRQATDALAARLVDIYKADEPDVLTVVLQSDGFADLLDRTAFLERISKQDQQILTRVRDLKRATKKQADQLTALEKEKQDAADAILAQKKQVTEARVQVVARQNDLADARSQRRTVLASVQDSRQHLEGNLKALQAEEAKVQARIRAASQAQSGGGGATGGGGPIRHGSGGLIWPVNGPIVSPFGMRWGRLHAGVDIAVPSGTPVHAAASGNVIIAGWVSGYGNYVCIAHGGPLSTCYGHNTSLSVSVGQSVKQGDVISSSGCTGHCFGPHVHFETRINGTPVDPMGYL
jgi:murein DD-endopeptidase MepM/ murein hydrolase activator NlpD